MLTDLGRGVLGIFFLACLDISRLGGLIWIDCVANILTRSLLSSSTNVARSVKRREKVRKILFIQVQNYLKQCSRYVQGELDQLLPQGGMKSPLYDSKMLPQ